MSDSASTLLGVLVGAFVGFVGSIGFYKWRIRSQNRAMRNRLKDELLFIRKEIQARSERGDFTPYGIDYPYFSMVRANLVSILNAETFQSVRELYDRINRLGSPGQSKQSYSEAVEAIDSSMKRL